MKILLMLLAFLTPLKNQTTMEVSLTGIHKNPALVFNNYQNQNFSQSISKTKDQTKIKVKNTDFLQLNLNIIIKKDNSFIEKQPEVLQETIKTLLDKCLIVQDYLKNISFFLKDNIRYSESNLDQSPESVITQKQANCIGFAQLSQIFFQAVGIKCQIVQGFYLNETKNVKILSPQSHLWLEISPRDNFSIFFDPQYQSFSHRYLLINNKVDFTKIKKFKVKILKKTNQFKN